jgi:3-phenylpropionate/trans-cinnamate dioxygenase ferredoxin reductase subunit
VGRVVVAGAGAAAWGAVQGLRQAGFTGEVVLVGREPHPPYERPPLSKRYLLGELERPDLLLPPPSARLLSEQEVVELEPDRHRVRLGSGEVLEYGQLLLATGARPRCLEGQDGLCLRTLEDATRLRELLEAGRPLEVVGAGFVGCEVAAAWRRRELEVRVYEALAQPLLRVLGPELGAWMAAVHREHGVELRLGVAELPRLGPWVLVAVGSLPNQELAQAAGIPCREGVLCDQFGRTAAPDVFAAGDCARFWSPLFGSEVRIEHFQTAVRHGTAVGRAMAGDLRPFAEAPWFWSDQYDLNLQYVGAALEWEEQVVRGVIGHPPFTVFFLAGGRLRAAVGVNDGRTVAQARRLLEAGVEVPPHLLADRSADLRRLPQVQP